MHLVLQFKENGAAYIYDLGSTHGTKINKRVIPSKEFIKMNHSDLFKLGESSRLYIYSFDQEEHPEKAEEEAVVQDKKPSASRKERMLKLYEENKRQQESFQSSIHGNKVGWGMNLESEDAIRNDQRNSNLLSEEDIKKYGLQFGQQINYDSLKNKSDLTDPQKAVIKKAESTHKRIEKLTNELEGIQAKQAKMEDLTEGQQKRLFKIETELEELRDTLENQEENIRNMISKCIFFTISQYFYSQRRRRGQLR